MRARSLTATVLGLLACVALPLALASAWTSRTVEDTDRFVAAVGAPGRGRCRAGCRRAAPGGRDHRRDRHRSRGPARVRVATALHTVVVKVVESDAFPPAWEAAVSSAHDEAIAVLEGKEPADGRISLRLGTLVNTVLGLLDERGLLPPSAPTSVEVSLPVMDVADLERARSAYQALDAAGLWLPLLWAALVAAHRRAGGTTGSGARVARRRLRSRPRAAPGRGAARRARRRRLLARRSTRTSPRRCSTWCCTTCAPASSCRWACARGPRRRVAGGAGERAGRQHRGGMPA